MIKLIDTYTKEPAIGYTDNKNIYIYVGITGEHRRILIKHEEAHIYLNHSMRKTKHGIPKNDYRLHRLWNIACDLEIAKNIYTPKDEIIIKAPRSPLKDIIVSDSYDTDELYAEGIYDWLLEQPEDENQPINWDTLANMITEAENENNEENNDSNGENGEDNNETPAELIEKLIAQIKEQEAQELIDQKLQQIHAEQEKKREAKKRSLSSALDIAIKKDMSLTRQRSYKRPPRYENKHVMTKGRTLKSKIPKVIIYRDISGSFDIDKTEKANVVIKKVVTRYRANLTHDTMYFANEVGFEADNNKLGSGTNYKAVLDDINENQPQIAIIITDDDHASDDVKLEANTQVFIVPVGCSRTNLINKIKATEIFV